MVTDQERLKIVLESVSAARDVIEHTADQEAEKYLHYLLQTGGICSVSRNEQGQVQAALICLVSSGEFALHDRKPLKIIPVFKEDYEGECRDFFAGVDKSSNASFWIPYNTIFVNACADESPFIKANILLHETGHAYLSLQKGNVREDFQELSKKEKALEEGRLYAMNARLFRLWGGEDYQVVLAEAFLRLEDFQKNLRQQPPPKFEYGDNWTQVFDRIFGPAPDQVARAARLNKFTLFAYLEWLESRGHKQLEQVRARAVGLMGHV